MSANVVVEVDDSLYVAIGGAVKTNIKADANALED
jgi:hypothetical protein